MQQLNARNAIRGMIEALVITPRSEGRGVGIDLQSRLAELLSLTQKSPTGKVGRF